MAETWFNEVYDFPWSASGNRADLTILRTSESIREKWNYVRENRPT